jgi:hypothetical protein
MLADDTIKIKSGCRMRYVKALRMVSLLSRQRQRGT